MLRQLSLVAALMLAPCLAFAANPSANLSVQVVPTGPTTSAQCPATAPAEAAQAGFTTMAFCNDFTQPIPNTAGTGLPATWLGATATHDSDPPGTGGSADCNAHVWYDPEKDFYFSGSSDNIKIVNDGGIQVVDLQYTANDQQKAAHNFMVTLNACASSLSQTNLYLDFPMGMFARIVSRNNINSVHCANSGNICSSSDPGQPNADFFVWSAASWLNLTSGNVIENDVFENIGNIIFGGTPHNWHQDNGGGGGSNFGTGGIFGSTPLPGGFTDSAYHTYDMLLTTDGSTQVMVCSWIDGTFYQCHPDQPGSFPACGTTPDNSGCFLQRNTLAIWSANLNWQNANGCTPGSYSNWCITDVIHHYIKSVQVWSCQDWQRGSTGPNPNCTAPTLVTGSDGSQFYKVTAQ